MRSYIFTDYERKLLKEYLEIGKTSDAYWMLLNRIKKNKKTIIEDFELLQQY